jgi:hypothetical protein
MDKKASFIQYQIKDMASSDFLLKKIEFSHKFEEVLRLSAESYLGRPFNEKTDAHRFVLQSTQGHNETKLIADGKHIGSIKTEAGLVGDDFKDNKITCFISFTPVISEGNDNA